MNTNCRPIRNDLKQAPQCRLAAAVVGALTIGAAPVVLAQQGSSSRLDEIIVTGTVVETPRRQIGTAVSVIDGPEITLRGYHSVADVLRTQPGISVTNAGGHGKTTTLRIRGEEAFRTLLVIDGVRAVDVSSPQHAPVFDGLLATGDLERIEVLRGPQGFIYGADAGGVVNVITRRGTDGLNGAAGMEYGRYGSRKLDASIAGGGERGDFYLSVTDFTTDGFNAQTADTVLRDRDGANNTTAHMRLGWNPSETLRVQLVARDIDAWTMFDGCFSMATFTTVHDCTATTEQSTWRVSADYDSDSLQHQFAYSEVDVVRESYAEGESAFGSRGENARLEYLGSFTPSDGLTLAYGLDFQNDVLRGNDRRRRNQRGYFVEYQGRHAGSFFVSAGLRYDDNDDFGTHTSGRLSGAYVQTLRGGDTLKYRASIGTGFRAPSLYEVFFNTEAASPPASQVTLKEETSSGYDLGVEFDTAGGLHVGLGWFRQRVQDEIYFDPVAWSGYLQAPGRSRSDGVELDARIPLTSNWTLVGNWTYNETETAADEPRLRRPRNVGNIGPQFTSSDDRLRLSANLRLLRGATDVGQVPLDNYRVVDLSARYALGDRLELHGRIENVTDERYEELAGFNTPGRALYGGVGLRF